MARIAFLVAIVGSTFLIWGGPVRADEPAKVQPPPLPADLEFVPRKVFFFMSIRTGDLSKTLVDAELLKKLQKNPIFAAAGNQGLDELERKLGIGVADIERVSTVMDDVDLLGGGKQQSAVAVVAASKAYDRKKVLEGLAPNAKEEKHQGKTCHVNGEVALHFIDDRCFCAGDPATVRKWLTMGDDERRQGPLQGALRLAVHNHLVLGLNPQTIAPFVALAEGQFPPEFRPLLHFVKTKSSVLAVHAGKELEIDLFLNFGDARARDLAVRDIKDALPKLQEALAPLSKMAADQGYAKTAKLVDQSVAALKKTPVREEDLRVHVPLYVPGGVASLRAVLEEVVGKAMPAEVLPPKDQP